jgi:mycothiol synthase
MSSATYGPTVTLGGVTKARWVVSSPTAEDDERAALAGLCSIRDLFQLRRPLPVEPALRDGVPELGLRPFRPGVDEDAWVEVNNRAFAGHPDQGGQTRADVERHEREPWFDPAGFLLLDADLDGPRAGHLDGFCWTKVHAGTSPPMGEIFVIGVDPSAHGRGLGSALTVAGLDHLSGLGLTVGMLYVDESNTAAGRMYARLGFTEHHRDRVYTP